MPRKNISWPHQIHKRASEIMRTRGFDGLSDLLQVLVREEYERRHPPTIIGTSADVDDVVDQIVDDATKTNAIRKRHAQAVERSSKRPSRKTS